MEEWARYSSWAVEVEEVAEEDRLLPLQAAGVEGEVGEEEDRLLPGGAAAARQLAWIALASARVFVGRSQLCPGHGAGWEEEGEHALGWKGAFA